jgi:putative redox protein
MCILCIRIKIIFFVNRQKKDLIFISFYYIYNDRYIKKKLTGYLMWQHMLIKIKNERRKIMAMSCSLGSTLTVKLETIDDKAMFNATARENPPIVVDYFPPVGSGKGYTSLELLMISFGSCVSTTLMSILRHRMKKSVSGISADAHGTVREEHPKSLRHILLRLKIHADDVTEAEVQEALKTAENLVCPVWAMIKGNVDVNVETEIVMG